MTAFVAPAKRSYDVVIAGGAVIGSAVAFWLSRDPAFPGRILVVERDPSYRFSSTALSASGIRQQYSTPLNVRISQFGVAFIREFPEIMAPAFEGELPPALSFRENGYLICTRPAGAEAARARVEMQRAEGAETVFLSPAEIAARFPHVRTDDLGGASWGAGAEGWFDAMGLLTGFARAARHQGVEYVTNEVTGLDLAGGRITAVRLATGERLAAGEVVNATGPRAAVFAALAGVPLPVEPRKRHTFVFRAAEALPADMPLVTDASGIWVRPEGQGFIAGGPPPEDGAAAPDDFITDHAQFETDLWPKLAHRIPAFEALRVEGAWTGHYAYNAFDQNAIVGRHPDVANLLLANGFSGHGLQQAPAIGRGVAELVAHGRYVTLDLSPFSVERIGSGAPIREEAVI